MNQTMVASDGFEYENLTKRLLGQPIENDRNSALRQLRAGYDEKECRLWYEAYDKNRSTRHSDKYEAGWRAISRHRNALNAIARAAANKRLTDIYDRALFDVLSDASGSGTGLPAVVQTSAAAVHPAD